MYKIGQTGLIAVIIYLLSLFLSRTGFISKHSHRKFWNWLLLGTFLITALSGLFMALQVNYRWEIPFIKKLLQWHVDFGIAMSFTGVIHLTWHLKYYFSTNRVSSGDTTTTLTDEQNHGTLSVTGPLLMITGFVSSSVQFVILREAMILGGGSEASAGVFLWLWLMISSLGTLAGSKSSVTSQQRMMLTMFGAVILSPLLYLLITTVMLAPGETPAFINALVILIVTITPTAFISAYVFVRLLIIRQRTYNMPPGNSFATEVTGSLAAGLFSALALSVHIAGFQLYLIVLTISLTAFLTLIYNNRARHSVWVTGVLVLILLTAVKPDTLIRDILLRGVTVTETRDTPFGNITTGYYRGEKTIFYDHRPLFNPGDIVRAEEDIHYALLQRISNERVMLISGGLGNHLDQLLKYDVREVVYLEHDPGVISVDKASDTLAGNTSVKIIRSDPLRYFRHKRDTFNAVIQLIPPSATLALNRYFTVEHFRNVRDHLSPGGVFMCTPLPSFNYSPASYRDSFSPVFNSMKEVFSHVIVVPGTLLYVIASDEPLTAEVSRVIAERGIINDYVNSDYIIDSEIIAKGDRIIRQVDPSAGKNSLTRPVSSWFTNTLTLGMRGISSVTIVVISLLCVVPFFFFRRGGFMMFSASAGLSGYGMITIYITQAAVGSMFLLTACIVSMLMAGLALGSSRDQLFSGRPVMLSALLLAVLYTLTGLMSEGLTDAPASFTIIVLSAGLLLSGFLTGNIFRRLTTGVTHREPAGIYAADLAGSALGYMVVSLLLIPLTGITITAVIISAVILTSGAIASIGIKH